MSDTPPPPGFRFFPTEEELLDFYLKNKLENKRQDMERVIPVVNIYSFDPWQLPREGSCGGESEQVWFYFCPCQERAVRGRGKVARTTPSGYWKAAGSPSNVYSSSGRMLGIKKTMVFYVGRAPNGTKTKWKMNEYRACRDDALVLPGEIPLLRSEFSICRMYTNPSILRSFDRRPSGGVPNAGNNNRRSLDHEASSSMVHNWSVPEGMGSEVRRASSNDHRVEEEVAGTSTDWDVLDADMDWSSLNWD